MESERERETEESGRDEEWGDLLRAPRDEEAAALLALVLDSRGIPSRLEPWGHSWRLLVPLHHLADAREQLRLFDEENRNWPPPRTVSLLPFENTLATLSVIVLLAIFHNLIQLDAALPGHAPPDWLGRGSAVAGRILKGEWWRTVTALTLHRDSLHLVSNMAFGGFLVVLLCRELGSGLAWALLLGSGMLGNLVNALFQSPAHSSIGASTLVFGAVGIHAALAAILHRSNRHGLLLPLAAGLALLALLGSEGKNTDLGAHLFGFLSGGVLGSGAALAVRSHGLPPRSWDLLLAILSFLLVLFAWWSALAAAM